MLTEKEKSFLKIQGTLLRLAMLNTQMLTYLVVPENSQPKNQMLRILNSIELANEALEICNQEMNKLTQGSDDFDSLPSFDFSLN